MSSVHSTLTRRSAGLPPLDAFDAGLRHAGAAVHIVTALMPFVTLLAFALVYQAHWYWLLPLVVLAHFVFVVSYLHEVAHGLAGLNPRQTHWVLFVVSVLVLQSGHSFRASHLHHHAHCLEDDDLEGAPARMPLWRVLLAGPGYLPRLWSNSLRVTRSSRERRWMLAELVAALAVAGAAVAARAWSAGPLLYCTLVYLGSWAYPLTTAYLPHYKPGARPLDMARSWRGRIVPLLLMNLTYHLEHHLYPQVPGVNLKRLAQHLDPLLRAR